MDYETYRKTYFADPAPTPRFKMTRIGGVSLSILDFEKGVAFYSEVLGPSAYLEGEDTRGWPIGDTWLTMFPAEAGQVANAEFQIEVASPDEVDRLHATLLAAGAKEGQAPKNVLCYIPIRMAYSTDPFGTVVTVTAKR